MKSMMKICVAATALAVSQCGIAQETTTTAAIPRLVDLGATDCVPCKLMKPILEALTKDYEGRMTVEFIDVYAKPESVKQYKVSSIPVQIFYGADGKELGRHEGFYSRENILKKWTDLGVTFPVAKK